MPTVELRHGLMYVDECDLPLALAYRWQASRGYAERVASQDGRRGTVKFHRVILNAPVGMDVDHINGNGLDNRRSNLRIVTHQTNLQNRRGASTRSRTGFRGVEVTRSGRYRARTAISGKHFYFGIYDSPEEAAAAAKAGRLALGMPS